MVTAKDVPPPFKYPPCAECTHPFGVHLAVGKDTTEKHRGPCSSGHGPKGVRCECRAYRVEAT